jgi:hypothetical protein
MTCRVSYAGKSVIRDFAVDFGRAPGVATVVAIVARELVEMTSRKEEETRADGCTSARRRVIVPGLSGAYSLSSTSPATSTSSSCPTMLRTVCVRAHTRSVQNHLRGHQKTKECAFQTRPRGSGTEGARGTPHGHVCQGH